MKTTGKMQGRRPMPKMRQKARKQVQQSPLTLGDLITAAYDALGDTDAVVRVLESNGMAKRVGRRLVFL